MISVVFRKELYKYSNEASFVIFLSCFLIKLLNLSNTTVCHQIHLKQNTSETVNFK